MYSVQNIFEQKLEDSTVAVAVAAVAKRWQRGARNVMGCCRCSKSRQFNQERSCHRTRPSRKWCCHCTRSAAGRCESRCCHSMVVGLLLLVPPTATASIMAATAARRDRGSAPRVLEEKWPPPTCTAPSQKIAAQSSQHPRVDNPTMRKRTRRTLDDDEVDYQDTFKQLHYFRHWTRKVTCIADGGQAARTGTGGECTSVIPMNKMRLISSEASRSRISAAAGAQVKQTVPRQRERRTQVCLRFVDRHLLLLCISRQKPMLSNICIVCTVT